MNQISAADRDRLNNLIAASKEYEAQLEQTQMQLEFLNQLLTTTRLTEDTIKHLENLQDGQEILLPLGNLAFIKAKVMDSSNVLVNVGASVVLKKPIEKALEVFEARLENLNKSQIQIQQIMQQLIQKIQQIRAEVEQIAQKFQSQPQQRAMGS